MKILIATSNNAKEMEISKGFRMFLPDVEVLTLNDVETIGQPEETGKTFEENAKLKAKFYADQTGLTTVADDGGLMIDALDGEPGVKSRRWPGYEATDEELIDYALKKLRGVSPEKRTAQLATCICIYNPKTDTYLCEQEGILGIMAEKPSGRETNGYPFRALFIVKETGKFYDEMSDDHITLNHRLIALERLVKNL